MTKEMLMSNNKILTSTYLYLGPKSLPEDFLSDEKEGYRLSRYCLRQLTQRENFNITNHLHLENEPQMLVSLSHTRGLAASALCVNEQINSIGVDIEWCGRKIREGSFKYFVSQDIELEFHSPLEIWCIKEAAFKAYSPIYEKNQSHNKKVLVLTDFRISEHGKLKGPGSIELAYQIREHEYEGDKFIIALAEF